MSSPVAQPEKLWGRILPASALTIRSWSYGTVKSSRLLDFQTCRFHAEGPFSERIFGAVSELRCGCGKFAGAEHVSIICDACGVKVGSREQRKQRFGSIELHLPILHPWWYGNDRRPVETLTALSTRQVRAILSRKAAIDFGSITANDNFAVVPILETEVLSPSVLLRRKTGCEAIRHWLWLLLGEAMESVLRYQLDAGTLKPRGARRRLQLIAKLNRNKVKPEDFVLEVIPVVPPGLRWIDLDEDGRIRVDPVTRCYQRIIAIDRSIRRLLEESPDDGSSPTAFDVPLLCGLEGRLRKAVRQLFAQLLVGVRSPEKVYRTPASRHNSLQRSWPGIDPAVGRNAVVVPDPGLRIDQCRVPRPRNVERDSLAEFVRKRSVAKSGTVVVFPPVRRLERLLSLKTEWSETNAIHVHPLLATWLGFSFDGQQALTWRAAHRKSLEDLGRLEFGSTAFDMTAGDAQWKLGADTLLGCYLATRETTEHKVVRDRFRRDRYIERCSEVDWPISVNPADEVRMAYESGRCQLQSPVILRLPRRKPVIEYSVDRPPHSHNNAGSWCTTAGRVLFNDLLPDSLPFFDIAIGELETRRIITMVLEKSNLDTTLRLMERLTCFGTEILTSSGFSLCAHDLRPPESKHSQLERARAEVLKTQKHFDRGIIARGEADAKIRDIWSDALANISRDLNKTLDEDPMHPLHLIRKLLPGFDQKRLSELSGMIGLVSMQVDRYPLNPITNSFGEGLSIHEYFQVACRARREQVDRVFKRRDARRLTRHLANVAQNVVISEVDCGTRNGVVKHGAAIDDRGTLPLERQIRGRVCNETIHDPVTDECVAAESALITPDIAKKIAETGIDRLEVRSPLTCEAIQGICQHCYGSDLRTGQLVETGTAVGTLAAMAIGSLLDKLQKHIFRTGFATRFEGSGKVLSKSRGRLSLAKIEFAFNEQRQRVAVTGGTIEIIDHRDQVIEQLDIPQGALILKGADDQIHPGDQISEWDSHSIIVYAKAAGTVAYHDIDPGSNVRYVEDSTAGTTTAGAWSVHDCRSKKHPGVRIVDLGGQTVDFCFLPQGSRLFVEPGQIVNRGSRLARLPRLREGVHDWHLGGISRFEYLISARESEWPAVLAEVSGRVEQIVNHANRQWTIRIRFGDLSGADTGEGVTHEIDMNRHGRLLVREQDMVNAGDFLTSGELPLHELLRITGTAETSRILLAELSKCFRCQPQPLALDERYLELIVSQLLGFVRVERPGDTGLKAGEVVSRSKFLATNGRLRATLKIVEQGDSLMPPGILASRWQFEQEVLRVENSGGQLPTCSIPWPASAHPLLLSTDDVTFQQDSFLTADGFSFDERALTSAALEGKEYNLSTVKDSVVARGLVPVGSGCPGSGAGVQENGNAS